ncbi:hypothetical protein [Halopiger xanaduensis]|uniref:hypothetical protein n=1 Tax=Halopiger xanaduensis TaxID=387343 RepID=UPI001494B2B5|nr:hypothetical protein [Halopiger xanaduensis]
MISGTIHSRLQERGNPVPAGTVAVIVAAAAAQLVRHGGTESAVEGAEAGEA